MAEEQSRPPPPKVSAPVDGDEVSLGKQFYNKVEANQIGIGPAFVERIDPDDDESVVASLRKRAGTASENLKAASTATLSRISAAAADVVPVVEDSISAAAAWVRGESASGSLLSTAAGRIRVKDLCVPGAELVYVEVHQTVGQLEALLREHHIHSVPVWNPPAKRWEGVVDTGDLVTWVSVKFPKYQLDAWTTFRQESQFSLQRVSDIVDVSQRNRFAATTPETGALALLETFRDQDVHRIFVRRSEHDLVGVVTHTDVIRFLHQTSFDAKKERVGDHIRARPVISCHENELTISAFKIMWGAGISAVAVVNDKGQATSCLTSYDMVLKADSIVTVLYKSIKDFQGRNQPNAPVNFVSIGPQHTFGEALEKMANGKVNHIFVVDDDGCPTAVLTARDMLQTLLPK